MTTVRPGLRAFFPLPAVTAVIVVTIYLWIISAGTWWTWPTYGVRSGYYDALADAFLKGQTHLLIPPVPELLALPDPYDSQANLPYRLNDAVLWRGRYYLYWGPVPALVLCVVKLLPGVGAVHDKFLVFGFAAGTITFLTATVVVARRRLLPDSQPSTALLGILACGLAYPMTYTLARSAVYEAAILGGQFFLSAGMFFLFTSLEGATNIRRLILGSALLAAAVGCRVTLLPAVAAVVSITAFYLLRRRLSNDGPRSRIPVLLALFLPFSIGCILLAGYNWVRFGSFVESGMKYVLAGHAILPYVDWFFSWRHVTTNLGNYLFSLPSVESSFPYLSALPGHSPTPAPAPSPLTYTEPICGLFVIAPFCCLAAFATRLLFSNGWSQRFSQSTCQIPATASFGKWFIASWWTILLLSFAPLLFYWSCSMRYLCDFWPSLALFAVVGAARLQTAARSGSLPRLLIDKCIQALAVMTILYGLLLSVTGYSQHFERNNPECLERTRAAIRAVSTAFHLSR